MPFLGREGLANACSESNGIGGQFYSIFVKFSTGKGDKSFKTLCDEANKKER